MGRTLGLWRAAAGVCLALATMAAVQAAEPSVHSREAISAQLRQIPFYQVLADDYPDHFEKLLDHVQPMFARGATTASIGEAMREINGELIARQLPKANVANTIESMKLSRDQSRAALAIDPAYCMTILGMGGPPITDNLVALAPLVQRELAFSAEMLKQTAKDPAPPPAAMPQERLQQLAMAAYDDLPSDQLRLAFQQIEGNGRNAKDALGQTAFCEFSIGLVDEILKLPPVEAAQTFRALAALDSK